MQLEIEKVEQLLTIINLYPAIRIMHFSSGSHLLSKKIVELCREHGYEYQLNCTTDVCFEKANRKYMEYPEVVVKIINVAQPRYTLQAKAYDYLFVTCPIDEAEQNSFLKKSYAMIKNAGLIVIFIPKDGLREYHLWSELLDENNFVATNRVNLFEHYDLIISKKMHGWGS